VIEAEGDDWLLRANALDLFYGLIFQLKGVIQLVSVDE
jgi:hypothetical protein